jgi:aspartyl-tRNA synthetase
MRTHFSEAVLQNLNGQSVTLCGWVNRRRDHGGVIFIDLRDITGLIQIVFEPTFREIFLKAEQLRSEFVVSITGVVRQRPDNMVNSQIATGQVEVLAQSLIIINTAKPLPFQIDEYDFKVGEETRLTYRYLDLRRPEMLVYDVF